MVVRISKNRVALENIPLNESLGANIASASTINLTTVTGNTVHITGTTAITAVTLGAGMRRDVIFDGVLTLTHHSTNNHLPGGANITTAVNDRARYIGDGTTVYCVSYQKADGAAVVGAATGTVTQYAGSSAPTGWLLCDGSAVSRTTYAALFTIVGTTYGTGDGSTTFNLPDIRGRVSIGAGQGSGLTNRTLAATGGAETHTLTIAEMPAHTHTYHAGQFGSGYGPVDGNSINEWSDIYPATSSTGGGGAHNNMQPFIVLNYIIKT